jgi:DNA adenine methylase
MRPLLKWAGGKAKLAPAIAEVLGEPCQGTYLEPFLGSGAVYLHLRAAGRVGEAVLSDVNGRLVAMHRAVQQDVDAVLEELSRFPLNDWQSAYYRIRDEYNQGPAEGPRHAARLLWLNRAGFNGLYRENREGRYNVPIGRYDALSLPEEAHFRAVSAALQSARLLTSSFEQVMAAAGPRDQVYCDPPYVPLSSSASFTGYCASPFGPAEQARLADVARRAALRGARVVLSNHDLPVVRHELYPTVLGFQHSARPRVARAISRSAHSRTPVAEVLAAIGPLAAVEAA